MRHSSVVALVAIALPTTAFAGHYHEETPEEKAEDVVVAAVDSSPHSEFGFGPRFGTFHTGPIWNIVAGVTLEGGVRWDRLALLGELQFLGLFDPGRSAPAPDTSGTATLGTPPASPAMSPPTGFAMRLGGIARYSVAKFSEVNYGTGARGDFFFEGGLGEELIRWSGGGTLHRADLALGAGFGIQLRGPHHHGGYYIGVRALLMQPPAAYTPPTAMPPTCAGPCDTPTTKLSLDYSIFGGFTIVFGG